MRKFNTMLVIALSFVGFSAFAETEVEANDSKEVAAVEVEAAEAPEASDSAEVASEVEVEAPSQE